VTSRLGTGISKAFFTVHAFQPKSNSSRNPLPARDSLVNWDFLILPNELISRHGPEITYMSRELYLLKGLGVFPRSRVMLSWTGSGLGEFFKDALV
jgi:hypothetical protein